eukprot:5311827-Amphidinium_carterae.1
MPSNGAFFENGALQCACLGHPTSVSMTTSANDHQHVSETLLGLKRIWAPGCPSVLADAKFTWRTPSALTLDNAWNSVRPHTINQMQEPLATLTWTCFLAKSSSTSKCFVWRAIEKLMLGCEMRHMSTLLISTGIVR